MFVASTEPNFHQ